MDRRREDLDGALTTFGFEIDEVSPEKVSGHMEVREKCCQPYKVLHGGVTALIAEAIASIGGHVASPEKRRVAGVNLSISHVKSAKLGDYVVAEATPLSVGKTIQVWDVRFWKCDSSTSDVKTLISSARLTLLCNLPVPESHRKVGDIINSYAKL
ncbi:1,4-dihydroxy-2-naphthoyl-CoA thioesterase 1-like [Andrographis paniculata]|uniref:1,4-dihydroxy-2-naphthoyl-CoA thioesterase 1-like n=1 Tax=Andrographis paniculata TaxID=175694 RepID=UPI0021E8A2B8|nr:1,4-dihydroxy-2-naphthoyl-CoA thioesterase 1-like [Andrographis paniculata]